MHDDAQASGLPFPPLLRKELFDPKGLPDWYCPTQHSRPLPAWALVAGCVALFAALLIAICLVPHRQTHRIRAVSASHEPVCRAAAAECRLALRIGAGEVWPANLTVGDQIVIAAAQPISAGMTVRVADLPSVRQGRDALVYVAWPPGVQPPTGEVEISVTRTRSLLSWLSLRRNSAQPKGRHS